MNTKSGGSGAFPDAKVFKGGRVDGYDDKKNLYGKHLEILDLVRLTFWLALK